jgi:hypothetical protein
MNHQSDDRLIVSGITVFDNIFDSQLSLTCKVL